MNARRAEETADQIWISHNSPDSLSDVLKWEGARMIEFGGNLRDGVKRASDIALKGAASHNDPWDTRVQSVALLRKPLLCNAQCWLYICLQPGDEWAWMVVWDGKRVTDRTLVYYNEKFNVLLADVPVLADTGLLFVLNYSEDKFKQYRNYLYIQDENCS